jgi:Uma2 family endonuclease
MRKLVTEKTPQNIELKPKMTLEEFLRLPEIDESYELIDGVAIKKMSAKFFRSSLTTAFRTELSSWCDGFG